MPSKGAPAATGGQLAVNLHPNGSLIRHADILRAANADNDVKVVIIRGAGDNLGSGAGSSRSTRYRSSSSPSYAGASTVADFSERVGERISDRFADTTDAATAPTAVPGIPPAVPNPTVPTVPGGVTVPPLLPTVPTVPVPPKRLDVVPVPPVPPVPMVAPTPIVPMVPMVPRMPMLPANSCWQVTAPCFTASILAAAHLLLQ